MVLIALGKNPNKNVYACVVKMNEERKVGVSMSKFQKEKPLPSFVFLMYIVKDCKVPGQELAQIRAQVAAHPRAAVGGILR